jgi:stage II sporulation protein M
MTWSSWRWLIWPGMAVGVFVLGAGVGAAAGFALPHVPIQLSNSIGTVSNVFAHNLVVLAFISLGALTVGLTAVIELFLNGATLGFVVVEMILRHQQGVLWTAIAPQFVFEVGAYVLSAAATLRVGWNFWWPFVSRRGRPRLLWRSWLVATVVATALLYVGAFVEVTYSHV